MQNPPFKIAVLGAGAWGTALAIQSARQGNETLLWCRKPEQAEAMARERENTRYLKGVAFPEKLKATCELSDLSGCNSLILAVPAQHLRSILLQALPLLPKAVPLVLCTKGVEISSGLLMTEMIREIAPSHPVCVLSGPTFAIEVAKGLPTAVTFAADDREWAGRFIDTFSSKSFRMYYTDDIQGSEIGGAVKNVIAIACGIVEGRQLGDNARAALISRGLSEMIRLGLACGGRAETLMGLSGLGDLTLTCTARQSRNYALGFALGQGQSLQEHLNSRNTVAEGVSSAESVTALAQKLQLDMPICQAVHKVLHRNEPLDTVISELLNRPQRAEPFLASTA
ncbi:NAD(P)H-dependent glycerol-3-phosphate dehydrogenase [Kiloniella sp. b19]|uniref:NAD(P)H-dependent glycerol-3-phosphate dehydrogenase n=1 Tax=Kiloniella sp. GXU_MW_B19 TaxID=3141326 RepID=UPI0031E2E8BB